MKNNMFPGRDVLTLFLSLLLSLLFIIPAGSGATGILFNGTSIYLNTGEARELYQGYVLILKSVSSDGSMWLQLSDKDKIVKSEIVHENGSFVYNKTNRTIVSVRVNKIYAGSSEQNLVSLSLYQFIDLDRPAPNQTGIIPSDTRNPDNNSLPGVQPPRQPVILVVGIGIVVFLFYIVRKLW